MANLAKFNRQTLSNLREQARLSLFFFQRAILGDKDLTDDLHWDLCAFLQGIPPHRPWTRALACAFRGSLKSSSGRAWMLWKALYGEAAGRSLDEVRRYVQENELVDVKVAAGVCIPNWSSLLIEQRYENAEAHQEMLQNKFKYGYQAALLQDLYSDRIPTGFADWNKNRTVFVRTDPNAEPSVTVAGLDSKLESAHKSAIICDDLEGADADKSDVPNVESGKFVLERAVPLLKEPATGQVLVLGTPHGSQPLVWKLRRLEAEGSTDNRLRSQWMVWWKEIVDPSTGQSRWAKRFTQKWVSEMQDAAKKSPEVRRLWLKQYELGENVDSGGMFDVNTIDQTLYELEAGYRIHYPSETLKKDEFDDRGWPIATPKREVTDLSHCRFFMHLDAKHRDPGDHKPDVRPSRAAIVVTALAPDCHVFVIETWIKDAGLDEFAEQFFAMYRKWAPYRFTMDTVGAQVWFKNFLRILETTKYRGLMSLPRLWRPSRRLPQPSSLLIEAHKSNRGKEEYIIQQLEVPLNLGFLHLHRDQVELRKQFEAFPSNTYPADGVDALSQGPMVWDRFISQQSLNALRHKIELIQKYRMVEPITGYVRGFETGPQPAFGPN